MPLKPKLRRRFHVLVALWWWDERLLAGILEVAHARGWVLDTRVRFARRQPIRRTYDGAIIFAGKEPSIIRLEELPIPMVSLDQTRRLNAALRVYCDDREIGRVAGRHLIDQGYREIGFVAFADSQSATARNRCAGLRDWCREQGVRFHELGFEQLRETLPKLPKPLGLLVANDELAVETMAACLDFGHSVPDEIAIVGVDDSELFCRNASVPLSSVNQNLGRWGAEAAKLLHGLMTGGPAPAGPIIVPPLGVSARASTDIIQSSNRHVIAALGHLRRHFQSPITIQSLVRHVGMSRQSLQNLFRAHVGHTMYAELTRLRVEHAKHLLLHGKLDLDTIATASGFTDRQQLHRAFRGKVGLPPAAWRKSQSAH